MCGLTINNFSTLHVPLLFFRSEDFHSNSILDLSNKAEPITITPDLTPSCMNVDTYAYDFFCAYFHECNSVTVLRMADCWSNINPDTLRENEILIIFKFISNVMIIQSLFYSIIQVTVRTLSAMCCRILYTHTSMWCKKWRKPYRQ